MIAIRIETHRATFRLRIAYARTIRRHGAVNKTLNDRLENEIRMVDGKPTDMRRHYHCIALSRVAISDTTATTNCVIATFAFILLTLVLWRNATPGASDVGYIIATVRYVVMFAMGLNNLPSIVQYLASMKDVGRRIY